MITCPNCGEDCEEVDLVIHDADCEFCDSEIDIAHCGCYYDEAR